MMRPNYVGDNAIQSNLGLSNTGLSDVEPGGTGAETSATPDLHPVLQSALGCLEVQLDEELARYRRQRQGRPSPVNRRLSLSAKSKHRPLDLIAIKPSAASASPSTPPDPPAPPPPASQTYESAPPPSVDRVRDTDPAVDQAMDLHRQAQVGSADESQINRDRAVAVLARREASASSSAVSADLSEPGAAGMESLATVDELNRENVYSDDANSDYLESSEHLLQSLVDEEAARRSNTTEEKANLMTQLLTPLGVGSLLLLLLSSVALGYVMTNPTSLSHLNFARLWGGESATDDPRESMDDAEGMNRDRATSDWDDPTQPNLANEEFVNLDLGTLSTLPGSSPAPTLANPGANAANDAANAANAANATDAESNQANQANQSSESASRGETTANPSSSAESSRAETASSTAAPANQSTNNSSAASTASRPPAPAPSASASRSTPSYSTPPSPPQTSARSNPAPPAPPPASSSAATASAESATSESSSVARAAAPESSPSSSESSGSGNSYYHVVTRYTGDQSLESAQQVVEDAYVHNSDAGATIRLGAFNDQAGAQEMVESLQDQGIAAEVESPE
jgi:hypothetical protein